MMLPETLLVQISCLYPEKESIHDQDKEVLQEGRTQNSC
jgi:hypothetical protein